jgi:hypothetical protein
VVEAAELAGALDRLDVERLLDDAELRPVAARVGADAAGVDGGDRVAGRAVEQLRSLTSTIAAASACASAAAP